MLPKTVVAGNLDMSRFVYSPNQAENIFRQNRGNCCSKIFISWAVLYLISIFSCHVVFVCGTTMNVFSLSCFTQYFAFFFTLCFK